MRQFLAFYFDPRGRVSRKAFWMYYAAVGAVLWTVFDLLDSIWRAIQTGSDVFLTFEAAVHFPMWSGVFELDANAPLSSTFVLLWLWPPFAISAKRLHDIGLRARWWLASYVAAGTIVQLAAYVGHSAGWMFAPDGSPQLLVVVLGVVGIAGIAASLSIGLLRGQQGANQYGLDPLEVDLAIKAEREGLEKLRREC